MSRKHQIILFFGAVALMSMATGIHDSIFNNFLSDTYRMSAEARGWVELPRETPGFLVVLVAGLLAALPVVRLGVVGTLLFACGMAGMGLLGSHFASLVAMMLVGSAGMHLLQPVTSSIAIGLSDEHNRGRYMGLIGMLDTTGVVLGTGFVWLMFDKTTPQYRLGFLCAAALGCLAAIAYGLMHVPGVHKPRARMVFRLKYRLYYLLELVFGARKQVFITFGPWVLIKVYHAPATSIAGLLMIGALIGIAFKPFVGWAIDHFGERTVMIADGTCLVFVCLGYGYAMVLADNPDHARLIACACLIADNLLFALGTARAVYLSRIADTPQELTSTLAMGISINHIVSMSIPALAGAIWSTFGYETVFLGAAVLAVVQASLALFVPSKRARLARSV